MIKPASIVIEKGYVFYHQWAPQNFLGYELNNNRVWQR